MDGFILIALIGAAVYMMFAPRWAYRYDDRNPYRRYCRECGQQQDFHSLSMTDRHGWWENQGAIRRASCPCHGDTRVG